MGDSSTLESVRTEFAMFTSGLHASSHCVTSRLPWAAACINAVLLSYQQITQKVHMAVTHIPSSSSTTARTRLGFCQLMLMLGVFMSTSSTCAAVPALNKYCSIMIVVLWSLENAAHRRLTFSCSWGCPSVDTGLQCRQSKSTELSTANLLTANTLHRIHVQPHK